MLINELRKQYDLNAPIYLQDVAVKLDITPAYARRLMSTWEKKGKIRKFDRGIYYFPKKSEIFGETPFNSQQVLEDKYLGKKEAPFGYYADYTLANMAGITTQVPAKVMIVSNAASGDRRREVSVGKRRVIVRRPKKPVTKDNVAALSLLDLISVANKYSELNQTETISMIKKYAKQAKVTKKQIRENIRFYPAKVSQDLIEMEVYDVLA